MSASRGPWRHRDFRRLWAGQTVSVFGTLIGGPALQFTAIAWLDAGPGGLALLAACQVAPALAFGLVAGAWVDRLRRRPVLITADAGRALALATIPLAAVAGVLAMAQLLVVTAIASALTVFFESAYRAYLPSLVTEDELVAGNSRLTASASAAEFASFGLGGWLVQLLTAPGTILIDALSFAWSALFVASIRGREPAPAVPAAGTGVLREIGEGLAFIVRDRLVRSLAIANVMLLFGGRIVGVVILLYLNEELGYSPGVLGIIFAVGGLSSLVGALFAERWRGRRGVALTGALVVRAAGMALLALVTDQSALSVALLVTSQLVVDPAWAFYDVLDVSVRQAATPPAMRGRMVASVRFGELAAELVAAGVAGLLGELVGLQATLAVAAGIGLCAAGWLAATAAGRLPAAPGPSLEPAVTSAAAASGRNR